MNIERLDPKRSVLLVIDVQERLFPAMADKDEFLKETFRLIEGFQILGLPIIISEQYPKGLGPTLFNVKELAEGAQILEKTSFSVFDDQWQALRERIAQGLDQWIICGIESHVCVYQTARDLLANQVQVTVAADAVSSRKEEHVQLATDCLKTLGAQVLPVETILFDLLQSASKENFKAISRLIR